jgi:hypothetical protein
LSVGSADLVHLDTRRRQLANQPEAIGAATLDANRDQFAELGHPRPQLRVSGQGCLERGDAEETPGGVDDGGDVFILVGVDTADDEAVRVWHHVGVPFRSHGSGPEHGCW